MSNSKPSLLKGFTLCKLGYLSIALMSVCAKGISHQIPIMMILFFQNAISLILTIPYFAKVGFAELKTKRIWLHLLRDLTGVMTFAALFIAIKYIPLVDAVLLQNTAPLWVPMWS